MELWQMDVVGGVLLADGRQCKVLTGIDDHSRFIVCAGVMTRATSRAVCAHFAAAMRTHGVPQEILTDNGKVFTGRFGLHDTEVLFDRICRENGIDHLLTAPRSPTTTGKIERFHRTPVERLQLIEGIPIPWSKPDPAWRSSPYASMARCPTSRVAKRTEGDGLPNAPKGRMG